jgi:hypothetical protein
MKNREEVRGVSPFFVTDSAGLLEKECQLLSPDK